MKEKGSKQDLSLYQYALLWYFFMLKKIADGFNFHFYFQIHACPNKQNLNILTVMFRSAQTNLISPTRGSLATELFSNKITKHNRQQNRIKMLVTLHWAKKCLLKASKYSCSKSLLTFETKLGKEADVWYNISK